MCGGVTLLIWVANGTKEKVLAVIGSSDPRASLFGNLKKKKGKKRTTTTNPACKTLSQAMSLE